MNETINELMQSRPVQQWLSWNIILDGYRILNWIEIDTARNGKHIIFEHKTLDCGTETYIDIGEFPDTGDPDEPEGKYTEFDSIDDVLMYAESLGAKNDCYVKFCEINYIYKEFLINMGPPVKGVKEWFIPG